MAARLQTVAEPGTVAASAATLALVEGLFLVDPLGASTLKGIAEPIEVLRGLPPTKCVAAWRPPPDRLTPVVGRRADLDVLLKWASAAAGRGAAAAGGRAGGGQVAPGGPAPGGRVRPTIQLDHCSCSPYTQMSVSWPGPGRSSRARAPRGRRPADPRRPPALRLHGRRRPARRRGAGSRALGLVEAEAASMAPERRMEPTIEVLVAWSGPQPAAAARPARRRPAPARPTSLDFLDELLATIGSTALLLRMTARPEFVHTWQDGDVVTGSTSSPSTTCPCASWWPA